MTALEKKRSRTIRKQAIFLTAIIYCSIIGGLLAYSGGGKKTISDKVKTFFQEDYSTDNGDRTIHPV